MEYFKIEGSKEMKGTLYPQGAKNEALQVLSAVMLTDEVVMIHNLPDIADVNSLINLLQTMGVETKQLKEGSWQFKAADPNQDYVNSKEYYKAGMKLRGSVMLLGPMLSRWKWGTIPKPGGDKIGRRRLDTHLLGLQKLGATFEYDSELARYFVKGDKLKCTDILQEEASVTGTANLVMTAVMVPGRTTIYNAACEPYIQQLCKMLNSMGARISGIGSNLLTIEGVERLGGCEHTILPDMIEIGSFIGLAAMTRSEITIKDGFKAPLGIIPHTFGRLGIKIETRGDDLFIPRQETYEAETYIDGSIMTISDAPWPGFTPDLISIALVVACQAKGNVLIHQKMFESRLFFVDNLLDMGAQIILCDPHRATVMGLGHRYALRGIPLRSPDIRAGVAMLIAALSAEGTSTIHNIHQIDRGYQHIDKRLNAIGASIQRCND